MLPALSLPDDLKEAHLARSHGNSELILPIQWLLFLALLYGVFYHDSCAFLHLYPSRQALLIYLLRQALQAEQPDRQQKQKQKISLQLNQ